MARRYTCGKTAKSWRRSLEIREGLPKDPGALPPSLTLEKLRHPHGSVPGNPLLAEPLYLTKYIERMGTGTGDVIKLCREAGLAEPEFTLRHHHPAQAGTRLQSRRWTSRGTKLALSGNQVEILRK